MSISPSVHIMEDEVGKYRCVPIQPYQGPDISVVGCRMEVHTTVCHTRQASPL